MVCDAVLKRGLCRRHLEITLERHLPVGIEREDGVGAPLLLIGDAATRLRAAAPFIGEEDLRSIVVERRRMPEREVRISHGPEAFRLRGVANVDEQSITAARTAGQADRGIDGDVMTLHGSTDGTRRSWRSTSSSRSRRRFD